MWIHKIIEITEPGDSNVDKIWHVYAKIILELYISLRHKIWHVNAKIILEFYISFFLLL